MVVRSIQDEGCPRRPAASSRAAFTLVEMLAVLLIISVLASVALGAYWKARDTAWREKTRDTARQLAIAWNMRLVDDAKFPDAKSFDLTASVVTDSGTVPASATDSPGDPNALATFATTPLNMALVCVASNNTQSRIYFEQNAAQRASILNGGGLKDHWNNFFYVRLDKHYDGKIPNPTNSTTSIRANVIVWSTGKRPDHMNEWILAFQ